jgi:predicted DCC family thiol-disulfide oxidoreductase YuxK
MGNSAELGDRLLVIFDGQCGLCNRAVRWFVRRDRSDRLRFTASDSATAARLLAGHGFVGPGRELGTIVVARDLGLPTESVLVRSEAVLAMLAVLPRPWPAVAVALRWIPRPVRELGYRLIARWRSRIWGRLDSCPIPTDGERSKFL